MATSTIIPFKPVLVSSTLPNYSPQRERSPGIHLSDVINDICLCWGYYQFDPNPSPALINKWRLGQANEWAFINQLYSEHPDRYLSLGEICVDGIYMNLDLYNHEYHSVEEFKVTWKSSRHPGDSEKFWSFWTQVKGYCKGINSRLGKLRVVFIRDDYKSNDVGYREWDWKFSRSQIQKSWDTILQHAESLCPKCKLSRFCRCDRGYTVKEIIPTWAA